MTDPTPERPQDSDPHHGADDGGNSPMRGPDGERTPPHEDGHAGRHGRPSDDADEGHS